MANPIAIAFAGNLLHGVAPRQRFRGPNKIRAPLISNEDIRLSLRLSEPQLDLIVHEYHQWRLKSIVLDQSFSPKF